MQLFGKYLKQRRRTIIVSAIFCFIFISAFALYHLPMEAILYPTGLCFVLGGIGMFFDFLRVNKRHLLLQRMETYTDVIVGTLPEVDGVEDEDYQNIIAMLESNFRRMEAAHQHTYSEMIDYYTVWAHQIKTPIAAMRLRLQNEDSTLARQLLGDLFRIEQYVEMVLTFLRLDSDSTDYVIKEYDLDEIVRGCVKKFAGEFISRKLKLIYDPLPQKVITDEKWLSFVIEQVLSNALKYTPEGSIHISIGEDYKLSIQDTGIGIAPEDVPRVFENGYTGCNGRSDKKASGIGLYLCKRICKNLGHQITIQSVVGQGTQVQIDLSREKLEVE